MLVFIARKRANGTCVVAEGLCVWANRGETARPPCRGRPQPTNREIVAERTELAALVLKVVDELGVFAVLAREDILDMHSATTSPGL